MKRMAFVPPSDWAKLYARLEDYRMTLKAPVDTIGCHMLRDRTASKETQRFHTLVALMLSAQTKDGVTAVAMQTLMQRGLTPQSVQAMTESELDSCICKVGFHNTKAKHIKQVADIIVRDYNGNVPREYSELIAFPGVGPKMANLFFQDADHRIIGIGVDTHVHRISQRFGWVPSTVKTPEDTRKALESWLPREHWGTVNHLLVGLGQTICTPLRPKCDACKLSDVCPNAFKETKAAGEPKLSTLRSPKKKPRAAAGPSDDVAENPTRKREKR
ncbi:putative endonuclease III [Leptomonas pyrrhocoris]|uniref:Endonuclease III homolog n=1 Tax=Leptomonas pyrrhocoris TaxID=157538 RepID=A0A0M9FWC8_LEPPY|nr:putative endonuclease III [Leptomonas pyrrhocoris]KPA77425.1 putative endonuclease III [Leptomonas pyrrhocoris]|eukprot:XP_015655864.1 putative endonuclease III [Leptomonas pyrrhocoris]